MAPDLFIILGISANAVIMWFRSKPYIKENPALQKGYNTIIGGFFMALTYSLDDFTVSFFVTGNGFSVLSVEVYAMARKGISMEINAISTILFIVILLGIIGYYLIQHFVKRQKTVKRGVSE